MIAKTNSRDGELMNDISGIVRGLLIGLSICVFLAMTAAMPSVSQENKITQIAGVDNTKMGAYHALAELSLEAFRKGDYARAAELARILERTWDAAEEGGGERALVKTNKDLFEQIDKAMDGFIKPVIYYAAKAPDAATVQAAYQEFLGQLIKGER
jgi:hypothetical protein